MVTSKWPIDYPKDYLHLVNTALTNAEVDSLRYSIDKGKPYGRDDWVDEMIDKFKLGSTLRHPGRPIKGS